MELAHDITTITTAGTRVQLLNSPRKARAVTLQGHPDNTGNVFVGGSDVSSSDAMKVLTPGESVDMGFGDGSINVAFWWADAATNGDKVVWGMVLI